MAQYPANVDLTSLNGLNGFKLSGAASRDYAGLSVASAGDVNGDGFADVIVGAPGLDANGDTRAGGSYVVFGGASGFAATIDLSTINGRNGFKLSGTSGQIGAAVASAGDVNGDGFDDVIIGSRVSRSYVVFGSGSGIAPNLNLSSLDGSNGFSLRGELIHDDAGITVASAGDINGDGFADVIVGAPYARVHGNNSGAAYVIFGKAEGFSKTIRLADLDGSNGFKIGGSRRGDQVGVDVGSAGDINGDGFDDVIVGTGGANEAVIVFGKASGFAADFSISDIDGTNGFRFGSHGSFAASAGDVNGDGFDDIINGDWHAGNAVLFGKAGGFPSFVSDFYLDGNGGFRISGSSGPCSSAGDVNGDGFSDLIVRTENGEAAVIFGRASGFNATIDVSSLDGSNGFTLTGVVLDASVSSAGDVNGDGFSDVIVGAGYSDPTGYRSGASYVVFGRAPDTAVTRVGTVASQTLAGGAFGDTLSGMAGDDRLYGNDGNDTLDGGEGNDWISGGKGVDVLIGFEGNDILSGGLGDDSLRTGLGHDTVVCTTVKESTGASFDTIIGFDARHDVFDLGVTVEGLDPTVSTGRLSNGDFQKDLAAAVNATTLLAQHAVMFVPDRGAHAGERFLIVDANGTAGYQANADFVFRLDQPHNLGKLSGDSFV